MPDHVGSALAQLMHSFPEKAAGIRLVLAHWHRIRSILFLERLERRESLLDLLRAVRLTRPKIRDLASVGLLLLPASWASLALKKMRVARKRK